MGSHSIAFYMLENSQSGDVDFCSTKILEILIDFRDNIFDAPAQSTLQVCLFLRRNIIGKTLNNLRIRIIRQIDSSPNRSR